MTRLVIVFAVFAALAPTIALACEEGHHEICYTGTKGELHCYCSGHY